MYKFKLDSVTELKPKVMRHKFIVLDDKDNVLGWASVVLDDASPPEYRYNNLDSSINNAPDSFWEAFGDHILMLYDEHG